MAGNPSLPATLSVYVPDFEKWIAESDLLLAQILTGRCAETSSVESDARNLEDHLLSMLEKDCGNKRAVIAALQISFILISSLNKQGWNLFPTRLAVEVRPMQSPFIQERIERVAIVESWKNALFDWIKNSETQPSGESLISAALISSCIFGCLLDQRKLVELANCLSTPVQVAGKLAFFDFGLPYRNLTGALLQRWIPDPISEMLLVRAKKISFGIAFDARNAIRLIKQFLKDIGIPKHQLPSSFPSFVQSACIYWESRGTQIDARYASSRLISQSLKKDVWLRINGCQVQENSLNDLVSLSAQSVARIVSDSDGPNDVEVDESNVEFSLIHPWLAEYMKALAAIIVQPNLTEKEQRAFFKDEISKANLSDLPLYGHSYIRWLAEMLDGRTSTGDAFQLQTILSYFRLAVPRLLDALGTEDLSSHHLDDLVEMYGTIIESVSTGKNRTLFAKALREFHYFLVRNYGYDDVDAVETFGREAEIAVVEARIISIDEYWASDEYLRKLAVAGEHPALIEVARLCMMLAFRLGMRRMEIMKLRICDLHLLGLPDILVRPHPTRRLKSVSSKRRLPLSALLEPDELTRLKKWADRRAGESGGSDSTDYLFLLPTGVELPIERTVNLIHRSIRSVTGDDNLHLHHLRHSFGTWTYLRLRLLADPNIVRLFSRQPLTQQYLNDSQSFRASLIPGGSTQSRSDAYCVSRLLGHSGPNVSLNYYLHCTDLLIYQNAMRQMKEIDNSVLIAASGLPRGSAYRTLRTSRERLLELFRKNSAEQYFIHPLISSIEQKPHAAHTSEQHSCVTVNQHKSLINQVLGVLHLHDSGISDEMISSEIGISLATVTKIIETANHLAIQIGYGADSNGVAIRLAPANPKRGAESAFKSQLSQRLAILMQNDPELLKRGIQIYFNCFNRHKKDVVFKSVAEIEHAKTYVGFLKAIGVGSGQIQLVVRSKSRKNQQLQKWKELLNVPRAYKIKRIDPPNKTKWSYSCWLGIQALSELGIPHYEVFSGTMLLTAIIFEMHGE